MKKISYSTWTKCFALCAVTVCAAATSRAQTVTAYGTGFDGTDIVNGTSTAATYNSPAANPTTPLSGQNGWTSNDQTVSGTPGTSTQLVGQSDFVGTVTPTGYFTGQNGVLGGIYRTQSPTASAPDVVPSTSTGGFVTLSHNTTIGAGASFINLDVDFTLTTTSFGTNTDTFGFSLRNASNASVIAFSFSPSTTNAATLDAVNYAVGTTPFTPSALLTLNGTYHLALRINPANGNFTASIAPSTGGGNPINVSGIVPNSRTISQFTTTWQLGNTTNVANGGYQSAASNYLLFDNLAVTVPEPSTYAMMALGLVGLAGTLRLRRQQA